MPTYVYQCPGCGEIVDKLRPMKDMDEPISCPRCGMLLERKQHVSYWAFKKRWIPTKDGWLRGDM